MAGLVTPDSVVQFRAVPYATIPARFKQAILLDDLSGTDREFTKPGFACPQPPSDDLVGGGPFPGDIRPFPMDEFKSLILQINVPLACLQSNSSNLADLPVMVYIHGGGFVLGKIDPQHSTAYIVEQSLLDSQPIIAINIQYRLGALGYLHTPDPTSTNLALHDQRTALIWIQRFISGFGGSLSKITAFGESAGGMSICYHMLSTMPVFSRVILMSGVTGPMTAPISVSEAEELYEKTLVELGIQERGEEGLTKLREIDVEKVVAASSKLSGEGEMWIPVQDEAWFGGKEVTWDIIPELLGACDWVEAVMLGSTGFEGTTLIQLAQALTPATFASSTSSQLGSSKSAKLLQTYNITPSMDQNLFLTAAMRWIGDVIFDAPTHALAQHLLRTNKKTYRYIFDVRNPFPGQPFYQHAHHWVDIYYLFKTFQFRYSSQRLKDISTRHAQLWITFANEKAPWTENKGRNEVVIVADEKEGWVQRTREQDQEIGGRNWDRCEGCWEAYAGNPYVRPLKIRPLVGRKVV
ncbi:alpha/beta-hydrolase [Zopfia rhizophila CBS 207.26]|uniref:Alpha/beta-hydrolase n=1 Tax=Zopfia rhizophila CBS 207.26 TaxID=1314779 RepID=A0A6A6E033_9PEZI|nr:alpha/beta-hydrolase [Zopfia rhizophila CBS 207.26]